MKQSVLVLGNSDSGLYDFRKEVLMALMQEGYEVHVSVPDTGYLEKIKKLGCICHETVMERRGMNPLKDGKLLLFYRKLLKTIHPAAVLTYTIKPNIYGGVACRLAKVPYLVNITGLGTTLEHDGALQKLIVLLYRTGMSGAGCVFSRMSRIWRSCAEGLSEKKDENPGDLRLRCQPGGASADALSEGRYRPFCIGYADHEG